MNDDPALLKEKVERYRRLLHGTDDARTKVAAAALLAELEAEAKAPRPAGEPAQERSPEDTQE